jgi:hypothetical protein
MSTSVVRIKFGSHLYGTDTPESDLDYKLVHIPDASDILLQRVKGSICNKRPKGEGEKNVAGEVDEESYSLQRYFELLMPGQTVAIDMLFAPQPEHTSIVWINIKANKHKLLTKKSAAFVGYCRQQANKYGIKGSRVAAAREATRFFWEQLVLHGTTAKITEIANLLPSLVGEHTHLVQLPQSSDGSLGWFFDCCNRKVGFTSTIKQAHEIYSRIFENYGDRARQAEGNEGVDWKALSHAVRVGQEAIELLETGNITFPLKNAVHILDIKKGRINYDEVANEIEELLGAVESASEKSSLPAEADQSWIDEFVLRAHAGEVHRWGYRSWTI